MTEVAGTSRTGWVASITYHSQATRPPTAAQLQHLVGQAQARNRKLGLTGMLLCDGSRFLQTLEGEPAAVDAVWAAIQRDPRHQRIEVLSQQLIPARLFSGWDMQFYARNLAPPRPAAGDGGALADVVPRVAALALAGRDDDLGDLFAGLAADGWLADVIVGQVLEPAARALGDIWLADKCCEMDLTIALSVLQLAGHSIYCHLASGADAGQMAPVRHSILLATAPGEGHLAGASFLGDMFFNAGWTVDLAFPDTAEALANQISDQRPDVVDIGLSDVLRRADRLDPLRDAVALSRRARPAEVMVISVGGRLFAEAMATAASVGADCARTTSIGTALSLAKLVEARAAARRGS